MVTEQAETPHEMVFWEIGQQTAVRKGDWKLVINGQLQEGAPPIADLYLSDLSKDMGEETNLKDEYPQITEELKKEAETWRNRIENRWENYWKLKME